MTTTATYRVNGMTCGHCVATVTGALHDLSGVRDVDIDLENGAVTVVAEHALDDAAVRRVVEEAGYDLAGTIDSK